MHTNIVWFRNDLRTYDNAALFHACNNSNAIVIGVFFITRLQWKIHYLSDKKIDFILCSVMDLKKTLSKLNIPLYIINGQDYYNSVKHLIQFSIKYKARCIFYNNEYEFNEKKRDFYANEKLLKKNITVKNFDGNLIYPINTIVNKKNNTYKSFFHFKKKIISKLLYNEIYCFPSPDIRPYSFINEDDNNLFKYKNNKFKNIFFKIGEKYALNKLKNFCEKKISSYSYERNFPFMISTSMLSPYLSLGIITSKQCLFKIRNIFFNWLNPNSDCFTWINEIIWREFYKNLIAGYPLLSKGLALRDWEKKIKWNNNMKYFQAWKQGKTGFPIIDAGMRQLNTTGWMHNRLRMLTANFLIKNLFIDWRKGEQYFMSQLIDGDFALNNGGWQWCASVGTDNVSYIRHFNPILQSKKIDPKGIFIKKYVPELKNIAEKKIHNPYEWNQNLFNQLKYPIPIIEISSIKKKITLFFNKVKY
ncbi:Deoxyribodipyrimidine photo-lyase [Buchnera aphidicola (Thelaxes suberi)]|uniref:deoxyribodipyrimidine photo-lyase n=1 Tax=Buchnera aphidicola TaxID=9 RepID=UPI003464DD63